MSTVEKIATRRRFMLMTAASGFLVWQVPLMDAFAERAGEVAGVSTLVSLAGFAVWIVALFFLIGPWRPLSRDVRVQAVLNDELTRANRAKAFIAGYIAMLAVAAVYMVVAMMQPVLAIEAAHMILVAGVAVPMYAFAFLERG